MNSLLKLMLLALTAPTLTLGWSSRVMAQILPLQPLFQVEGGLQAEESFDPYLIFADDQGELIARNNDISAVNPNAVLAVALPASGRYRVLATARQADAQGPYPLTIYPTLAHVPNPLLSVAEATLLEAKQQLQEGIERFQRSEFRAALSLWEEALARFRADNVRAAFPQRSRQGEADALGNLGGVYYSLGDYAQALDFYQQSLDITRQIGDQQDEAKSLGGLGNAYYALGDYAQAIDFHQQSLDIARQIGDRQWESASLGNLGVAYDALGDYAQAIDFHQQSLAVKRQIGDRRSEAKSLGNLGNAYSALGDYVQAIDFHQQSLDIARQIGDRQWESASLGNLGVAYDALGDYAQAIDFHQQSLAVKRQIGDRRSEAKSLGNLGNAYSALGDYVQAIDFHEQAISIARQLGDRQWESASLGNLGVAYDALGDYAQAIDFHQQQLAIARQLGDRRGEASALGNLGVAYDALGEYEQALDFHQQQLAIARQLGDRRGEAIALGNLGLAYYPLGDYEQALDFHHQQLAIARQLGDRRGEAIALGNLGTSYYALGDPAQALDFLQQQLAIAHQLGDRQSESQSLHNLGLVFRDLDDLAEAVRYFQLSAQVKESLHSVDLADASRLSLLDSQQVTYRLWQTTLMAQGQPETALEVAERGRAQALAASMARSLDLDAAPPNLGRIQAIAAEQNATLVEYSVLPSGRILIWVVRPDGSLQSAVSDDAALDDSLLGDTDTLVSLGPNRSRGAQSPEPPLSALIQDTQVALTVRGGPLNEIPRQELGRYLQQLHAALIEPIAQWLPEDDRQRVIFIPHRELFRVPFAALQDDEGRYLIQQHTILTAPSIQSLELARQHRDRIQTVNATDALVVGNPAFPDALQADYGWQALPGAEREAQQIGGYLSQHLGTPLEVLFHDQATETRVKERLHDARFIHLATHGSLASSGEAADLPGLQYSLIPGVLAFAASDQDDGRLTADELLELTINDPLNAELVVLSACQTGQGTITSDGVYGLSRTLLRAGVPTLVVSLWDASDYHTVELMDEFYRQFLEQGQDKAQALRQAMLRMIEQGDNNPQYWAAFTLVGEAQ